MGTIPASENEFPSVLFAEGAAPATPAAGLVIAYAKSDGLLYWKDDAGTEYPVSQATDLAAHLADTGDAHDASAISIVDAGTLYTATDVEAALAEVMAAVGAGGIPVTLIDAKGDLIAGTAADTADNLTVGANGAHLEAQSGEATGLLWRPFVGASYTSNAAQSHTSGTTLVIVDYEDVVIDPLSDVTVGASWAYTAPFAGTYLVTAHLGLATSTAWSASSERAVLQLYKNGAFHRTLDRRDGFISAGGAVIMNVGGSCFVELAASDTIDVRFSQNSGSTIAQDGTAGNNYIDIVRLR